MTKISLIVAMDAERGIGRNNDLMWHLPADMNFFKTTTKGQIVVMGRKNYDSIPEKFRPLPGRENVVLTRNKNFSAENCLVFHDLNDCLKHFENESERTLYIIGGGEIYKMALEAQVVKEMFITHIEGVFGAETFFPEFNANNWKKELLFSQEKDEKHTNSFSVFKYTLL
jgi:dihydrofolate reductase